jgi:hypothetical protein
MSFVVSNYCFMCTVWKVFCFSAQYRFLMYRLESVLFLCTLNITDVPSGKCSVSVRSTHFWCTVWKVFCFCAQYTFLIYLWKVFCLCAQYTFFMYRLKSVLFLCTVHISDAQWYDISLSNRFLFQVLCCSRCFLVILPWRRQLQFLSKNVTAFRFLMNVTDTKYLSYTRLRVRYDVFH